MAKILLVYPKLGSSDALIRDLPLSLLYAAVDSIKASFDVKIIDLRFREKGWQDLVRQELTEDTVLVGVSVMTGSPIKCALEVTELVKAKDRSTPVVWGGPHPTIEPDTTLKNENIDFLIKGYSSKSLCALATELSNGTSNFSTIEGLSYRNGETICHNPAMCAHEMPFHKDIPYHLIDVDWKKFGRFDSGERIFPVFTSLGCHYNCGFCISPAIYSKMGKRWVTYRIEDVISHIEFVMEKYNANYISFYDDDSFHDLDRMRKLFQEIKKKQLDIIMGFRGARINEIDKMDTSFLELMQEAGVRHMQIGVESGSPKILKLMHKGINIEQIIRVNKKLSQFPKLRPLYNIMAGVPGETLEDLKMTKDLMLTLIKDNPYCLTGAVADFKPIPGSRFFKLSLEHGLKPPQTLEQWSEYDTFDTYICHPWYEKSFKKYINMMQVTSYFIDDKITKEISSKKLAYRLMRLCARLYKPIALLRLKKNITGFLIEYKLMGLIFSILGRRKQ